MAYNTFTPPIRPKVTAPSEKPNVITNDFGDNYSQVIRDGIHPTIISKCQLEWETLTQSQCDSILAFLLANAGIPFYWNLTYETANRLWIIEGEFSPNYDAGNISLSVNLREVYA